MFVCASCSETTTFASKEDISNIVSSIVINIVKPDMRQPVASARLVSCNHFRPQMYACVCMPPRP